MTKVKSAMKKQTIEMAIAGMEITAMAAVPGSRAVLAALADGTFTSIDETMQLKMLPLLPKGEDGFRLAALKAISPRVLLAADINQAHLYDLVGDRLVETQTWCLLSDMATANCIAVAADASGQVKAAVAYDYLHLLHDDGTTTQACDAENGFWGLAVSAEKKWLANGRKNGEVELRDPKDLSVQRRLAGLSACALAMDFSPDGKHLAASDDNARLMVWNLETGQGIEIPGWSKIIGLFWFSDSSGFVAVSLSRMVFFIDLESLASDPDSLTLSDFSPNYIQHAVLRGDDSLLAWVEKNGIVHIRLGS